MIRSDYQSWSLLTVGQKHTLNPLEVYKACVIAANNGWRREEENGLSDYQKSLLDSRRLLKANRFEEANGLLSALNRKKSSSPIDSGDREFLKGMVLHRLGDQHGAVLKFAESVKLFSATGDSHRLLRALINEKIVAAVNLQPYLTGDLFVLQNQAIQTGFHDLAGNVFCARASELIVSERHTEAIAEASEAIKHYTLASCPEDLAVAQMMLAIARCMSGDTSGAKETYDSVHIRDGKIASYIAILDTLMRGKRPVPPKGHPLSEAHWKIQGLKKESITGKIVSHLKESPATRDELIVAIWGDLATHPSYCSRLYSAINELRKKGKHQIIFDGEKYTIVI